MWQEFKKDFLHFRKTNIFIQCKTDIRLAIETLWF